MMSQRSCWVGSVLELHSNTVNRFVCNEETTPVIEGPIVRVIFERTTPPDNKQTNKKTNRNVYSYTYIIGQPASKPVRSVSQSVRQLHGQTVIQFSRQSASQFASRSTVSRES